MTLNFLRVKAIHDQFCLKFGSLSLPLTHEFKHNKNKRYKKTFTYDPDLMNKNLELNKKDSIEISNKASNRNLSVSRLSTFNLFHTVEVI